VIAKELSDADCADKRGWKEMDSSAFIRVIRVTRVKQAFPDIGEER
jgi:hypothetical protein